MQETLVWFLDQEITWRRERLPTPVFLGFPCGSAAHSEETWVWSLGWEESPGEGKCYPLHYSGLENSMDCIVHRVIKSGFHFTSCIKIFSNFSLSFHFLKWWLTLKFLPLSDLPVLFFMFYLSKPQDHKNIKVLFSTLAIELTLKLILWWGKYVLKICFSIWKTDLSNTIYEIVFILSLLICKLSLSFVKFSHKPVSVHRLSVLFCYSICLFLPQCCSSEITLASW